MNDVVDSNGITTYARDFENRLTSVTLPGSGGSVSFKYDPFGRRIYKSSAAGTSIYAYDGDNLVEETNTGGVVMARYEQGLNIDEPLAMLRGGATSYYHADGLGSVTSLTNEGRCGFLSACLMRGACQRLTAPARCTSLTAYGVLLGSGPQRTEAYSLHRELCLRLQQHRDDEATSARAS